MNAKTKRKKVSLLSKNTNTWSFYPINTCIYDFEVWQTIPKSWSDEQVRLGSGISWSEGESASATGTVSECIEPMAGSFGHWLVSGSADLLSWLKTKTFLNLNLATLSLTITVDLDTLLCTSTFGWYFEMCHFQEDVLKFNYTFVWRKMLLFR